jgi:hypothetical protein
MGEFAIAAGVNRKMKQAYLPAHCVTVMDPPNVATDEIDENDDPLFRPSTSFDTFEAAVFANVKRAEYWRKCLTADARERAANNPGLLYKHGTKPPVHRLQGVVIRNC